MRISMIVLLLAGGLWAQTLQELAHSALEKNYKVKSFLHQIGAAKARLKQARDSFFPKIDVEASYGKDKYEYRYPTKTIQYDQRVKSYTFSLNQPIYEAKLFSFVKENRLRLDYANFQKEEFLQSLYKEIADGYIEVVKLQQMEAISLKQYENFKEMLRAIQEKEKLKLATITDRIGIEAKMKEAFAQYRQQKLKLKEQLYKLKLLTKSFVAVPSYTFDIENLEIENGKIAKNPKVMQYRLNEKIAQNEIEKRKSQFYPNLDLSLSYGDTSSGDAIVRRNNFRAFLQMRWELFDKTRYSAVEEAQELYLQAKYDYKDLLDNLSMEEQQTKSQIEQLLQKLSSLQEAKTSAQAYLQRSKKAYLYRVASLSEYYSAQNDFFNTEQNIIATQAEILHNLTQLAFIYGKLNDKWLQYFQQKYFKER